jgi:hypothetical protein
LNLDVIRVIVTWGRGERMKISREFSRAIKRQQVAATFTGFTRPVEAEEDEEEEEESPPSIAQRKLSIATVNVCAWRDVYFHE